MADETKKAPEAECSGSERALDGIADPILSQADEDTSKRPFAIDKYSGQPFSQEVIDMISTLIAQRRQIEQEINRITEAIKDPLKDIGTIFNELSTVYEQQLVTFIHPDKDTAEAIYQKLLLYVEDAIAECPDLEYASLLDRPFLLKVAEIARNAGEDIPRLLIEPKEYRTRGKIKNTDSIALMPRKLSTITLPGFHNGLSFYANDPGGKAYLQLIKSADNLMFKDGQIFFEGMPASAADLQNITTKENIENIDLPLLKMFYSIILYKAQSLEKFDASDLIVTLHVADLAAYMGINVSKSGLHRKDVERIIEKTKSFHDMMGVITEDRNGKPAKSYFPVLNFEGYDDKQATIRFSSPYMNRLINMVYRIAIRRKKDGTPKLSKSGKPLTKPSHSYLIHSSIARQKNKAAAENVIIIVTIIERAGNNTPHITAKELIERNPGLRERILTSARPNQLLARVFRATWKMLRDETDLTEAYKDISLPDPDNIANIPTMDTLNTVFEFPHNGKKKTSTPQVQEN